MNHAPSTAEVARAVTIAGRFMSPDAKARFQDDITVALWPEVSVIPARNGEPALSLDGGRLLCSSRDPGQEAERQIVQWEQQAKPQWDGMIIQIGLAGPWHLQALLRRLMPGGTVILLEPRPELLAAQLAAFPDDLFAGMDKTVLMIAAAADTSFLTEILRQQVAEQPLPFWSIWQVPGPARFYRESYDVLTRQMSDVFRHETTNRTTTGMYASLWYHNAVTNLPVLWRETPLEMLRDTLSGHTALIIAAGPSLDRSLPRLKEMAGRCLVIAVGAALGSLRRHGIRPHLVVSVDSAPEILRQFAGSEQEDWFLAAPFTVDPELFRLASGRSLLFTADLLHGFNYWLEQQQVLPLRLRIGGTVTVSAIDLAICLGCRRLLLAGLDLAFGENDATHAEGAIFGGMRRLPPGLIEVPGNFSAAVRTTRQFAGYINILAAYFARASASYPGLQVININDRGAKLGEIPAISPENLHEIALPDVYFDYHEYIVSRQTDVNARRDKHLLSRSLHEAGEQFQAVAALAADAEAVIRTATGSVFSPDEMQQIDRIDTALQVHSVALTLIDQLFQTLCRDVAAAPAEMVMAANLNLYRRLREIALWSARQFEQTALSLQ